MSSAELESACNGAHEAVLETAAVGVPPPGGGPEKLHVFVVFKPPSSGGGAPSAVAPSAKQLKMLFNKSLGVALG